jgi:hypothetical protein
MIAVAGIGVSAQAQDASISARRATERTSFSNALGALDHVQ